MSSSIPPRSLLLLAASAALIVAFTRVRAADDRAGGDGTPTNGAIVAKSNDGRELQRLDSVLAAGRSYDEQISAIAALAAMRSQPAATVLIANITAVKYWLRQGKQMTPVIGSYPCAFALVEIGTNAVAPLLAGVMSATNELTWRVCAETLRHIAGENGAAALLARSLGANATSAERARETAAVNFLHRNSSRPDKDPYEPPPQR